jgi:hypothetical protein
VAQRPKGESDVSRSVGHRAAASFLVDRFAGEIETAGPKPRLAPHLVGRQASVTLPGQLALEVIAQLLFQLGLEPGSPEEIA